MSHINEWWHIWSHGRNERDDLQHELPPLLLHFIHKIFDGITWCLLSAHTHTVMCLHTHTQSCVCTHTHSHVSAHTHTVMSAHTHTVMCLHTHTQSWRIWISHVIHMNESCRTYEWVMAHINESRHIPSVESWHVWKSHGTYERVTARMQEAWVSQNDSTYQRGMAHTIPHITYHTTYHIPYHIAHTIPHITYHTTYQRGMAYMKGSRHIWKSHATCVSHWFWNILKNEEWAKDKWTYARILIQMHLRSHSKTNALTLAF